jgi:hypothetical protein
MTHLDTGIRVAGAWLAMASALMAMVLVGHGPIPSETADQMTLVAGASSRWIIVHWIAAASLSLFAITGLIVLTASSRLTEAWWTMSAWAVVTLGALWTMTTAVAEATAVPAAARAEDLARFEAWWAFAEGKSTGFMFLALAVAVIAWNETRMPRGTTPAWAAWIAVAAGVGAFLGWPLGMWFGVAAGSVLWLASSLVMSLWTFWFGWNLARTAFTADAPTGARSRA